MPDDTKVKKKSGTRRNRKKEEVKNREKSTYPSREKERLIQAIGFIETVGLVPAIEAADVMCKAADVRLSGIEKTGSGLVTVKVRGDVSSVEASVSSGRAAAERLGHIMAVHVIPRPSEQVENIL